MVRGDSMKNILIVILLISLTGCGIFNLDSFVTPDDLEFYEMVKGLETPEKIAEYMLDNFTYEEHLLWTPSPYNLWKTKKGDCNDFSTFGVFIADWHGYETYQIKITWKDTISVHYIAVYKEDYFFSLTDNRVYLYGLSNFQDAVLIDSLYLHQGRAVSGYTVYDYEMNIIERRNY